MPSHAQTMGLRPLAAGALLVGVTACGDATTLSPLGAPPARAALALDFDAAALTVGGTGTLQARRPDARGQAQPVTATWRVADSTIAVVQADGRIVGRAPGSTVVWARVGADSVAASVSVTPGVRGTVATLDEGTAPAAAPSAASAPAAAPAADGPSRAVQTTVPTMTRGGYIVLATSRFSLETAATRTLEARVFDAQGREVLPTPALAWSSLNPATASVSATGVVTGLSLGTATLLVRAGTVQAAAMVSVIAPAPAPPTVARVVVTPAGVSTTAGESVQLVASARTAGDLPIPDRPFTWTSSNAAVATVSSAGLLRAVAAGTATVTVTTGTVSATVPVTVAPPAPVVAAVALTPDTIALSPGGTAATTVVARTAQGTIVGGRPTSYVSTAPAIATVSATGTVTAVAGGTARVIATVDGIADTAVVTVNTARSWYVAPDANALGDGTRTRPWMLATALNHPTTVQPGDTIWLLGGTYRGEFTSRLTGTAQRPIVVRQAAGARATVDGRFQIDGAHTWYWGFEVMYSDPKRESTVAGSDPTDMPRERMTVFVNGPYTKLIHLVIHDMGDGIFSGSAAEGAEFYGLVLYNNGWIGPDRGHGHNMYLQNRNATKLVADNAVWNAFATGIKLYGSSAAFVQNVEVRGNTSFLNGGPASHVFGYMHNTFAEGGGVGALRNIRYVGNSFFHANPGDDNFRMNCTGCSVGTGLTFTDNTVYGESQFHEWFDVVVARNRFTTGSTAVSGQNSLVSLRAPTDSMLRTHRWSDNRYASPTNGGTLRPFYSVRSTGGARHNFSEWRGQVGFDQSGSTFTDGPFSGVDVIVRPSPYEPGRALVTVWNWSGASSASVDVTGVLAPGDQYTVHHVYDVFGTPVASGTYTGGTLAIPVRALTPPLPIGTTRALTGTGTLMNAYVIRRR